MPTYKQSAFIRRATETLFDQQFKEWELLVIDDGSPENILEILTPYLLEPQVSPRWVERGELTTDDLDRMYWSKVRQEGEFLEQVSLPANCPTIS